MKPFKIRVLILAASILATNVALARDDIYSSQTFLDDTRLDISLPPDGDAQRYDFDSAQSQTPLMLAQSDPGPGNKGGGSSTKTKTKTEAESQARIAEALVSQEALRSIQTPDEVKTSIGTLNFIDGAPLPETSQKVHDYLDTMRGVDAFMKGIPAASIQTLLEGMDSIGTREAHQIPIWEDMGDRGVIGLTWNATTMYIMPSIHLDRDGPIVAELPAGLLGVFQDAWFRYVGVLTAFRFLFSNGCGVIMAIITPIITYNMA